MESIWEKEIKIDTRETLMKNEKADVVVIGAGLAGILTGYTLQKRGCKVIVLEADRIGSGQTKHTTAKITKQHGAIYQTLLSKYGAVKTLGYAKANERAIWDYKKLIRNNNIDCDFEEKDAYICAVNHMHKLEKEMDALNKLKMNAEFTTETELPFAVQGAIKMEKQAQFHPLKLLKALSKELTVYEHSKVLALEEGMVITEHAVVRAEHIVVACHYPFLITPGYFFMRLHQERSYVMALKQQKEMQGMYLGVDEDVFSFRSYKDMLLLGGGGHRTGKHKKVASYRILKEKAEEWYPNSREECRWAAQDCMPAGQIPYIGDFSNKYSGVYVTTGFQKWGMTSSMVGARLVTEKIIGQKPVYEEVFAPGHLRIKASVKEVMKTGGHSVIGLAKRSVLVPAKKYEEVRPGTGGVITHRGQKIGVYKSKVGEVHLVDVRCPHLGCMLIWNQEELSWDCPCHGSRYDYRGEIIDNPTLRRLNHEKKLL